MFRDCTLEAGLVPLAPTGTLLAFQSKYHRARMRKPASLVSTMCPRCGRVEVSRVGGRRSGFVGARQERSEREVGCRAERIGRPARLE